MSHACHRFWTCYETIQNLHGLLTFDKVLKSLHLPREITSEPSRVVRACGAFKILTWKCASRHNRVHFFNISTSKSALNVMCFVHFDFEMCFTPQRRALFRHLNFQKWSGPGVFCTFGLRNVLRTTTACNFSSLIWPASAPAALASLLFDPPEPQIIGKHSKPRLFYLFAHLHLLSSDSFSSLIFSLLLFSSVTLLTSAFPSVHTVGSLTSKLPSVNLYLYDSIWRCFPMAKAHRIQATC